MFGSGFILALCALSVVEGQRPKTPIITPIKINPTSLEMQVQIPEIVDGKHLYLDCFGHSVQLKLKEEDITKFRFVPILEKKGGFTLEGLEPELIYDVRVACKSNSSPPSVGDWTDPTTVATPKFGSVNKSDKKEKDASGGPNGAENKFVSICVVLMSTSLALIISS